MTDPLHSPEMTLLRAACGAPDLGISLEHAVEATTDWGAVASLARKHALSPILAHRLEKLDHPGIPKAFLTRLGVEKRRNALDQAVRDRVLEELRSKSGLGPDDLRELKGGQLGRWAYGDPRLRQVGDLDILVRDHDAPRVDHVIRDLGYRQKSPRVTLDDRTWPLIREARRGVEYRHEGVLPDIDLHWRWTANPHVLKFDARRVWQGSEADQLAEMFLFLVVHGGRHSWCRLSWLLDIHELVTAERSSAPDWSLVAERARKLNAETWLSLAFSVANRALGTPCPIKGLREVPRVSVEECLRAIAELPPEAIRPISWRNLAHEFRGCGGAGQRLSLFWFALVTPSDRDIEAVSLPRGWESAYVALRPFLWLSRRLTR